MTGYRRRGTRLAELYDVLGSQITARAIFEPLQSCPADAPAWEMSRGLEQRDFDVVGVRNEREGLVTGFVRRKNLKAGAVRDHVEPLCEDDWVRKDLALALLIQRLKNHEFVLVRLESNNAAIITQADLNEPPVRVYLFGLDSKKKATTRLKQAEDLGNTLAHSHYDLVPGTSWKDLFGLVEWMEEVIHASDRSVEQRA